MLESPLALDPQNMLASLGMLPDQIEHAWKGVSTLALPDAYRGLPKIAVFGMGGSALGADVIQHLYSDSLSASVTIVNDYRAPGLVGPDTLAILSSYSGTTEEVLAASERVLASGAKVIGMSVGKELAALAEQHSFPFYRFDPTFNPCGQPRIAVGYSVIGQMAFLSRLGYLPLEEPEVLEVVAFLRTLVAEQYGPSVAEASNAAKRVARLLVEKMPALVASEHLVGTMHVGRNQLHENAKHFAVMLPLPEMNHHAMEGLEFPGFAHETLFLLFRSALYGARNQKRYDVLATILKKQGIVHEDVAVPGSTRLQQAFAMMLFSGYTSFYVAMLHGIDPSPIPWVDLFKKELAQ